MANVRQELVADLKALFPKDNFVYGGFRKPVKPPYGLYARERSDNYFADDVVTKKFDRYYLRLVVDHKDFSLEQRIEDIFDSHGIGYNVDFEQENQQEKVYVTEWSFGLYVESTS